jgi:hypothetical protein
MKLAGKRRWWLRVPLFVIWMMSVGVIAFLLTLTNPTLSLGRNLSALNEEETVAVLAMIDQMKINRYIPEEGPLILNDRYDRNGMFRKACAELTRPVASAMTRVALSMGHAEQTLHCDDAIGYIFYKRDGEYQAGFMCRGWCGSGHSYIPTQIGPVVVLWRVGEFLM